MKHSKQDTNLQVIIESPLQDESSEEVKNEIRVNHSKDGHHLRLPIGTKYSIWRYIIFEFSSVLQTLFRNPLYPAILLIILLIWSDIEVKDIIALIKAFKELPP